MCSSNMLGIHALSASLSLLEEIGLQNIHRIVLKNTSYLIDLLNNISEVKIITHPGPGRPAGIVSFKVNNRDSASLHQQLLKNRVICAHRGGGIRFSPHFYITTDKLEKAVEILAQSVK